MIELTLGKLYAVHKGSRAIKAICVDVPGLGLTLKNISLQALIDLNTMTLVEGWQVTRWGEFSLHQSRERLHSQLADLKSTAEVTNQILDEIELEVGELLFAASHIDNITEITAFVRDGSLTVDELLDRIFCGV